MSGKNKFGFDPLDDASTTQSRKRSVGPMGAAVRDAASSLNESTEQLVEQRRRNAADAKAFRAAADEGRVIERVSLDAISTDDLPRDRLSLDEVARSDEMEELKSSIRERGQKEPIEVYRIGDQLHLKKGWRRLTALRQLYLETGDEAFASVLARVLAGPGDRIDLYIDMVEENVIREDLSFAEMAQLALTAEAELSGEFQAEDLVSRLYANLHKMKRSYIRSFVALLREIGDVLPDPKALPRNLGVEVARKLQSGHGDLEILRQTLAQSIGAESQNKALSDFLKATDVPATRIKKARPVKVEFHVGETKVTARSGECRILSDVDFSGLDRQKLRAAIEAFEAALKSK